MKSSGLHHADHALDQVVAIAERAGLGAVAEDRDVLAGQRLADEVRDDAAVEGMHARAVGVEDPHDADVDAVHAVVVHEQRFGGPLAFVVAGPRADRVDAPAIAFGLGVDLGIAVDLAGRGLQDCARQRLAMPSTLIAPMHRGLHGLDRVVLVVARRGGAGQIVDLVDLEEDRHRHVVADQLEVRPAEQVGDVRLLAGEEIVQADHVVAASTSRSQRWEPRKPAPPVTRIRLMVDTCTAPAARFQSEIIPQDEAVLRFVKRQKRVLRAVPVEVLETQPQQYGPSCRTATPSPAWRFSPPPKSNSSRRYPLAAKNGAHAGPSPPGVHSPVRTAPPTGPLATL